MAFMVWGHRGHQHIHAPEKYADKYYQNSMRAFVHALTYAMGLETDTIKSKNGTIYLTHDTLFVDHVTYELKSHLDAASQQVVGNRYIYELNDDEAGRLHLKDGQKITKLTELLQIMPQYPGRVLNLELKGPGTGEASVALVQQAVTQGLIRDDQIVFSSFNLPELAALRRAHGARFKIGILLSMKTQTKSRMFPDWPNAPQDAFYTPFNPAETVLQDALLREIEPDFFHLERRSVTREDIDLIDRYYPQAKITLWCLGEQHPDDSDDVLQVTEMVDATGKLHAVITAFPKEFQDRCEKRGLNVILPG